MNFSVKGVGLSKIKLDFTSHDGCSTRCGMRSQPSSFSSQLSR